MKKKLSIYYRVSVCFCLCLGMMWAQGHEDVPWLEILAHFSRLDKYVIFTGYSFSRLLSLTPLIYWYRHITIKGQRALLVKSCSVNSAFDPSHLCCFAFLALGQHVWNAIWVFLSILNTRAASVSNALQLVEPLLCRNLNKVKVKWTSC